MADAHNARVGEIAGGFREHDRFAVSKCVQIVLDGSPYPEGFPAERHAGYVPESALLAVEWFLPTFDIIPKHKMVRHIKTRKAVEPTDRSPADAQRLYNAVIAQVAVRTVCEVFAVTPEDTVSTVVFTATSTPPIRLLAAESSRRSSQCARQETRFLVSIHGVSRAGVR